MKNNQAVLLVNHNEFLAEFQQMLIEHKSQILKEIRTRENNQPFTIDELSKFFKCSTQTIRNWSAEGILNPIYVGHRVYYKAEEVQELLNR